MRLSSLFRPTTAELTLLLLSLCFHSIRGVNFTPAPLPNLDLSQLGRVALAGDFDAISLYTYQQQNENVYNTNGSQSLLTQLPNGDFATLASADASIDTMCPLVLGDGTLMGIVVGGNFTSLGGIETQGAALYNVSTGGITPLPGLTGQVSTLFCDQTTSTVFVGGDFTGANSTNAIAWVGMTGWTNLPFAGFNGPVQTINMAPSGNIIFGGSFTGLGNASGIPDIPDQQIINLSSATITAGGSNSTPGFSDPRNIICSNGNSSGPGQTWLLADETPGFWQAEMNFGFQPTKLRIWSADIDGKGTATFRFTALPINGIMNLTYIDPATNQNRSCSSQCPISSLTSDYIDFRFVNVIGMNGFRLDISDWYGSAGGLNGIELFQDQMYAFAVSSLDEPACAVPHLGSNATTTGPWKVTPSQQSSSEYLTADLIGPGVNSSSASVTFLPDIRQSGNYTVMIYTPGCQQDNTCTLRGISNVTGNFTLSGASAPLQTNIFQTNDFDKYDQIYHGYVDAASDSFRPSITLAPLDNQNNSISLVANRVRFQLDPGAGGLNGLFEWNPNQATASTNFANSTIDAAGTGLQTDALVMSLEVIGQTTYVSGNFTGKGINNIFALSNGNVTSLPNAGLNAAVASTFVYGDFLILGGNFTNTTNPGTPGLNYIAAFDTSKQAWQSLGNGVNGQVTSIVPLMLNITNGQPETCITVNGIFNQVLSSGSSALYDTQDGFAIWVPSHNDWLQNLNVQTMEITGQLSATTNISGTSPLLAGTITAQGLGLSDGAEFSTTGSLGLTSLGIHIQPQQIGSSQRRRAVSGQNVTGAVVGLFDTDSGRNTTIIGGHFTAIATNGSTINNLAIINSTASGPQSVTGIGSGLDADSVFLALATANNTLYAGGTVSGTLNNSPINGLVLWDLTKSNYVSPQPPALSGSSVAVNAITIQPDTPNVYVAGNFDKAGGLNCPSICLFTGAQWQQPGNGLGGSIGALTWQGNTQLLVGGNLTVGGNTTNLATYDTTSQVWAEVNGASAVPGPVTALSPANSDASQFWVAGKSTNGSAFLMLYDGTNFQSMGDVLGTQTTIRGLSMLSLSQNHADNSLVPANLALLVTGQLDLPSFGNASAALFNGTTFSPFILSNSGNGPGSISQLFTENQQSFSSPGGTLKLGYVILIALACALGCLFLIILTGFIMERRRKRMDGYRPAPQNYYEKTSNMTRVPPEHLFSSLGQNGHGGSPGPRL
ncbi:hypothetical protein MMC13_006269 [Lambiella insularis]|nr:hypothetical protein [Lambiella insularis]